MIRVPFGAMCLCLLASGLSFAQDGEEIQKPEVAAQQLLSLFRNAEAQARRAQLRQELVVARQSLEAVLKKKDDELVKPHWTSHIGKPMVGAGILGGMIAWLYLPRPLNQLIGFPSVAAFLTGMGLYFFGISEADLNAQERRQDIQSVLEQIRAATGE